MKRAAYVSLLAVAFAAGMASAVAIACKRIIAGFEDALDGDDPFYDPFYDDDEADDSWREWPDEGDGLDPWDDRRDEVAAVHDISRGPLPGFGGWEWDHSFAAE